MKVILKKDIKSVGKKGEVINASDGYARNYLFPRNLAVEATEGSMRTLQAQREEEAKKKAEELKAARELAKKMADVMVVLKVKTGENGRLFGSITSKDVAERLKEVYGIDIDKKKITIHETIKAAGVYQADVKLYTDVTAKIRVSIESL